MKTTRDAELQRLAAWRPRDAYRDVDWFQRLVEQEFLEDSQRERQLSRSLGQLVGLAASTVPYYRDLAAQIGLKLHRQVSTEQLRLLPVLTKDLILRDPDELTTTENHPSWKHMYMMMMFVQVGLAVAYIF